MGLNNTIRLASMRIFAVLAIAVMALSFESVSVAQDAPAAAPQQPTLIRNIQVQGNQRVEANTVASYLLFAPGDPYSEDRIDVSIKTLYATGLFADVAIEPSADGNVLIRVIENPIINRVILEGNKSLKSDKICLLYTSPSPRDGLLSRMPSSA